MVESAAATDVVGNTTFQPAWVSWAVRSVASTLSSSTTRIERPLNGLSTIFTHDFEAHSKMQTADGYVYQRTFRRPGNRRHRETFRDFFVGRRNL